MEKKSFYTTLYCIGVVFAEDNKNEHYFYFNNVEAANQARNFIFSNTVKCGYSTSALNAAVTGPWACSVPTDSLGKYKTYKDINDLMQNEPAFKKYYAKIGEGKALSK